MGLIAHPKIVFQQPRFVSVQAKTTVPSLRQSRLAQALKNMFVIGRVPVLP